MLQKWLLAVIKFIFKNRERFVLFISGAIITGIASAILEKTVSWSIASLIGITIVLVLSSIFFFAETRERVQVLADAVESSVRYVEEPFRESEGVKYKGILYEVIERLVRDAETEILVLASTYKQLYERHSTDLHPSRMQYLTALEDNIRRHASGKFEYVRILQIQREHKSVPIPEVVGELTANHCRQVLQIAMQSESPDVTLAIMAIDIQMTTSFIIIDRRYVIIEIDGLDSEGDIYAAGLLVIEDRGGRIVKKFIRHFVSYQRLARELTLDDFGIQGKKGSATVIKTD
jgi:hypothetical protein